MMSMQTPDPYELIRPLGEGGMGQVFLAFDPRLKRQVALKCLKESLRDSQDSQRRFRREAQLVANLNHRAIVGIYDIVEWDHALWLVMEYVAGPSLRQLLASGPLAVSRCLDLAMDLAAGLMHAHQQGIVHRDLKAENILFDAAGQPKIADFGIARNLYADHEDQNLTDSGAVMGTVYAMSPEQAMGRPADFASDLFSYGVLLYECLTGISPFKGLNRHDTLQRVLHHEPEPVHQLCPEVPQAFSALIAHLLQKKAELRPRDAGSVFEDLKSIQGASSRHADAAETLAPSPSPAPAPAELPSRRRVPVGLVGISVLLVLVLAWVFTSRSVEEPSLRIGILDPPSVDADAIRLQVGVDLALRSALSGLDGLEPVSVSDDLRQRNDRPAAIAQAMAVDQLIRYDFTCRDQSCTLFLEGISASGEQIWQSELPFSRHHELLLARALSSFLDATYARDRSFPDQVATLDDDDYAVFLNLNLAFFDKSLPLPEIARGLADLRQRSPDFLEVYLLEAKVAGLLFGSSRDPAYLDHGLDLTERAKRLQPLNPRPFHVAFDLALGAGRLAQADRELQAILQFGPERANTLKMRAIIAEKRGEKEEALRLYRLLAERVPSSRNLYDLANLERRLGLDAEARLNYARVLEKDPRYLAAKRNLAGLELISGDVVRAESLLKALVAEHPSATSFTNLSLAYLLLGKYDEAVTTAAQACERAPKQIPFVLNYADALAMAGRRDEAESQYLHLLALIDGELDPKRFLAEKAQAYAQLGKRLEAVEAIQESLSMSPDQRDTAYAAALVYCLIGDRTSALVNAARAVEGGFDTRWFRFPWFDGLRDTPEFQAIMAGKPVPSR